MNFKKYIGKEYTKEIKMLMTLDDGDLFLRIIGPGNGFTEDCVPCRTNIFLNESNIIIRMSNG